VSIDRSGTQIAVTTKEASVQQRLFASLALAPIVVAVVSLALATMSAAGPCPPGSGC